MTTQTTARTSALVATLLLLGFASFSSGGWVFGHVVPDHRSSEEKEGPGPPAPAGRW